MPKLITTQCELELNSYPKVNSISNQPWDAADLYLIECAEIGQHLAILNDQWGALTCFASSKERPLYKWTDSFCSQKAIKNNLYNLDNTALYSDHSDNTLQSSSITDDVSFPSALPNFSTHTDCIWIYCPKSFDQLHWWLSLALEQLGPGISVYLAGMAKHIPIKWLNWLETHNTEYQQFPIKKKARLMYFKLGDKLPTLSTTKSYIAPDNVEISALPGVFSRDHMDIGSRFFIQHLSQLPPLCGKVVDLGCGNGLLSIAALLYSNNEAIELILCDDSALALESARNNLLIRNYDKAHYIHTDALLGIEGPVETILCNPPFHSGNRVSTAAAERMFKQAGNILSKQGQLLVIANRHLGYLASLKKSFADVQLLASDSKFVIYRCTTPGSSPDRSTRSDRSRNTYARNSDTQYSDTRNSDTKNSDKKSTHKKRPKTGKPSFRKNASKINIKQHV